MSRLIVNPLMGHPLKGWTLLLQNIQGYGDSKSYCIISAQSMYPSTTLKTYVLDYDEIG